MNARRLAHATNVRRVVSGIVVPLLLVTGVLTGVVVAITPGVSAAATSQDWPTYLHDTSRNSATTDANLSIATAEQLTPTGSTQTGGIIEASPSIVGTTAYVGSFDGYEYAMNTTTGAVL